MKHLLHIAVVYVTTLLATLCSPDINNGQPPEKKPLEVNIRNTELFLKYGLPTQCTYTVENLTGNLHEDVAIDKHADAITVETPSPEAADDASDRISNRYAIVIILYDGVLSTYFSYVKGSVIC